MKARLTSRQKAEAQRLFEDEHERIFRECADDILQQAFAAVFWTLAINNGWGAGRLRKLAGKHVGVRTAVQEWTVNDNENYY